LRHWKTFQHHAFATGKPSGAWLCHWKTLQRRIMPAENLSTPGFGLGKTYLTASDLEAEALGHLFLDFLGPAYLALDQLGLDYLGLVGGKGLGHPCERPLGNLDTVRVAQPGLVSGCKISVPKKDPFFEVVHDGMVVGGLGMGQGGG